MDVEHLPDDRHVAAGHRWRVRDLDVRRAMLAVLLDANEPLTADDVVSELWRRHGIDLTGRQRVTPRRRVSDSLRALERRGRARRVRRGAYVVDRTGLSRSTIWRCHNWKLMHDRYRAVIAADTVEPS